MRSVINRIVATSALLAAAASAQQFRFVVSEYLGTPGEFNTWDAWYATIEGTTGGLFIGDEVPAGFEGVTDVRVVDWTANEPRVLVRAEPASETFPEGSFLLVNRRQDGPVLFSNDEADDTEEQYDEFFRHGTYVLPVGLSESRYYLEESETTPGTYSINWYANGVDAPNYRRVNLTAVL